MTWPWLHPQKTKNEMRHSRWECGVSLPLGVDLRGEGKRSEEGEFRQREASGRIRWMAAPTSPLHPALHPSIIQYTFRSKTLSVFFTSPPFPLYTGSPSLESLLSPSPCHPFHIPQIWPQGWETSLWNVRTLLMFFFLFFSSFSGF